MAINKSNSPAWVKVTLIVLIVAFVLSFITIVANPFKSTQQQTTTQSTDPLAQIDAKYQPQVAALTTQLQSEPTSYTVLVNLGNTYFDYALEKQQASQTSTSAVGADQPLWIAAKDSYSRALALRGDEPAVRVDYSISLYYSGDTPNAIVVAEKTAKDNPRFSPAFFNLGIYFQDAGDTARALAAFEQYLKIDPTGKTGGSVDYAKQQISALKGSTASTSTP